MKVVIIERKTGEVIKALGMGSHLRIAETIQRGVERNLSGEYRTEIRSDIRCDDLTIPAPQKRELQKGIKKCNSCGATDHVDDLEEIAASEGYDCPNCGEWMGY